MGFRNNLDSCDLLIIFSLDWMYFTLRHWIYQIIILSSISKTFLQKEGPRGSKFQVAIRDKDMLWYQSKEKQNLGLCRNCERPPNWAQPYCQRPYWLISIHNDMTLSSLSNLSKFDLWGDVQVMAVTEQSVHQQIRIIVHCIPLIWVSDIWGFFATWSILSLSWTKWAFIT